MALDADATGFTTWTDAEVAERTRFGQSKFERIAQNQIGFDNRLALTQNNWSLATIGGDFRTHFTMDPDAAPSTDYFNTSNIGVGGSNSHDENANTFTISSSASNNTGHMIYPVQRLEPDNVPILFEARTKVNTYSTTSLAAVGLVQTPGDPGGRTTPTAIVNGAFFITGATSGTWDAVTVDTSTVRTQTASISGMNYTAWDYVRIVLDGTDAKFYVHDGSSWVLKATHSTSLSALMGSLLYAWAAVWVDSGSTQVTQTLDLITLAAATNAFAA